MASLSGAAKTYLDVVGRIVDGGPTPSVPRRLGASAVLSLALAGEVAVLHDRLATPIQLSGEQAELLATMHKESHAAAAKHTLNDWVKTRDERLNDAGLHSDSWHWNLGGELTPLSSLEVSNSFMGADWEVASTDGNCVTMEPTNLLVEQFLQSHTVCWDVEPLDSADSSKALVGQVTRY